MVARIWYGYTTTENADSYYSILINSVIPGIEEMNISGFKKIDVLKRNLQQEVEFITIMYFESIENIKDFVGEDFEVAHVPKEAQPYLKRWDRTSSHFELVESIDQ